MRGAQKSGRIPKFKKKTSEMLSTKQNTETEISDETKSNEDE
jgi:hypothetical protein